MRHETAHVEALLQKLLGRDRMIVPSSLLGYEHFRRRHIDQVGLPASPLLQTGGSNTLGKEYSF